MELACHCLRAVNDQVANTRLSRNSTETIKGIRRTNRFEYWWHVKPLVG